MNNNAITNKQIIVAQSIIIIILLSIIAFISAPTAKKEHLTFSEFTNKYKQAFFIADANNDQKIGRSEMGSIKEMSKGASLKQLITSTLNKGKMDLNKDGIITYEELFNSGLIKRGFSKLDKNNDLVLSKPETHSLLIHDFLWLKTKE